MFKWKRILLVVIFAIILLSCGKKDNRVKIRFATWDNAETLEFQKKMVEKFNKSQDKIQVLIEAYGENYDTKITASMGSFDAPDVMYMWNFPKYSEGLLPLDEMIKKEGDSYKNNFYEALWNYNSVKGNVYGLPVGYTTHVLYYNKDLFDKAGIEYPNNNWTWEDVEKAAAKLTNKTEKIYGFAFSQKPDPYDYEMFAWSNGGSFNPDMILDDKSIEPFKFFQKMIREGNAISTEDGGEKSFLLGKIGMFINGAWSLQKLQDKKLNFGVEVLPKFGSESSQSIISSSGVSISKTTKHPEEAWEFIKYWTSEEMNKNRLNYELPVLKSVAKSENLTEDKIKGKFYKMLEQSQKNMPTSFVISNWSDIGEKIGLALEKIFNKNSLVEPKEALFEVK